VRAEPPPTTTRAFALVTGSLGLLAIGVLVMTVTPRRQESPLAISATTTPLAIAGVTPITSVTSGFVPTLISRPLGFTERDLLAHVEGFPRATPVLATPIGDGQFALVTEAGLGGERGPVIAVRFASGDEGTAAIVSPPDQPIVVVSLASEVAGSDVAHRLPQPNEVVTVMASPPVAIRFADVGTLDVGEGTAVLDGTGALVGLCSRDRDDGATTLITVSDELVGATSGGR
jgi:hypothetical protein